MKTTKIFFCIALVTALLNSCRQEDDYIRNYAGNDALTMDKAGRSFGNEFDALWTAINTNYAAWEIETVNWDEVYNTYKPKFVEFDTLKAHGQIISDEDFTALYKEVLDTLHDGHSYYVIKNLSTGYYTEYIYPQKDRNIRRFGKNYNMQTAPFDPSALTQLDFPESKCMHVNVSSIPPIKTHLEAGLDSLHEAEKTASSDEKVIIEHEKIKVEDLLGQLSWFSEQMVIEEYNMLAASLDYAKMPLYYTSIKYPVEIMSAISNDGIAYLRFSIFYLTPYLSLTDAEIEAMTNKDDAEMYTEVRKAWRNWFDNIQTMAKNGTLKGVIIDVRSNGGGMNSDQKYTLGALLPSGGYKIGTYKTKIGTGRLDYSVDMDFKYKTMDSTHVVVTDQPIVIMCNHTSCSNSETVAALAKMLPNGIVVGCQTYGAMSCLMPGQENYSLTYGGEFGVDGTTAIYGYQPLCLINYTGLGVLESKGVTPDISVNYDMNSYHNTGRDNQLEAALKAIRGK